MPKTTPRDFFLQLGVIAGLYVSAVSLFTLLFQIINLSFPDALERGYHYGYYDPYGGGIRFAIAALIVIFPLYLILARALYRTYQQDPTKRELGLRKWVSYFTLFVAGVTVAVDLITLINSFLGGELSTRFALKVLAVLIVAGGAFWYYLYDLKQAAPVARVNRFMALLSLIIVVAAIVAGFMLMGSPFTQRERRFDEQKIQDLQTLQWQVISHWQTRGFLPESLALMKGVGKGDVVPRDPQTGEAYDYRVTGPRTFELGASFNQPTPVNRPPANSRPASWAINEMENWTHETGRVCFERTIDPVAYPPTD